MEILKEYISILNGILSLTVLGFIIRFSIIMKNSFKEKEDILLKRIDSIQDDLNRTEKWANRKEEDLIKEKNEIQNKLDSILKDANIDLQTYNILEVVTNVNSEFKKSIKELAEKIEYLHFDKTDNNINLNLSMAKAFAANEDWIKAAEQFEIVTKSKNDSWELYFSQGIAFANSRLSDLSNLKSLQSYSSAIAFLPKNIDQNTKARLFIYRGALLKRLNRLHEAESDIKIGLKYANSSYEINDGLYNLACVYAMLNRKKDFLEIKDDLKLKDRNMFNYLMTRLKEYAPDFKYN